MRVFPWRWGRIRPISRECSRGTRFTTTSETRFSPPSRRTRRCPPALVSLAKFIKKYVPGAESFGTVQVGNRADLLNRNPLDSVENVREPVGVMAAGQWMPASCLHDCLDDFTKMFAAAKRGE